MLKEDLLDLVEANTTIAPCQKKLHAKRKNKALTIINLSITNKIIIYIQHFCDPKKI
jgi:hypothetical protein